MYMVLSKADHSIVLNLRRNSFHTIITHRSNFMTTIIISKLMTLRKSLFFQQNKKYTQQLKQTYNNTNSE